MGIKKLYKYLLENQIVEEKHISEYQGKKIAIDISILLYQLIISIRNSGDDLRNQQGEVTSHILGLFNKTIWLLSHNILPVYIFDGKPPNIKKNTLQLRRDIRERAKEKAVKAEEENNEEDRIKYFKRSTIITTEQIIQCKELLDYMGIPYFQAEGEADVLCAQLAIAGLVDAVSTEDMDILTFGSPKIIKNLFSKNKLIEEIKLENILTKMNLNYNEFVRFSIFLGCDYNPMISNITFEKALLWCKNYLHDDQLDKNFPSDFSIDVPFEYFTNHPFQNNNINLNLAKPKKELINLLIHKYGLIKQKIMWKINLLNKMNKIN